MKAVGKGLGRRLMVELPGGGAFSSHKLRTINSPMKRFMRLLAFGAIFVLVSSCAVYGIWFLLAKQNLRGEIDELTERSEPLHFSDLGPVSMSPEQNGTVELLELVSNLDQMPRDFDEFLESNAPAAKMDGSPSQDALEVDPGILDAIDQAAGKRRNRLPIDYSHPVPIALDVDYVAQFRKAEVLLGAAAIRSLGIGDHNEAVRRVHQLIRLSEMLRDDSFLIPQLTRIAIVRTAIQCVEEVLRQSQLDDNGLIQLDECLTELEDGFTMRPAVNGERAALFTTLENIATLRDVYGDFAGVPHSESVFSPTQWLNWSYRCKPLVVHEQAYMLREMGLLADLVDQSGPAATEKTRLLVERWSEKGRVRFFVSRHTMIGISAARSAGLSHLDRIHTARLGIRVDKFYRTHGNFPDSLADVLDERLTAVPVDLHTGNELVFNRSESAFAIYPVGKNGIDDGGGDRDLSESLCCFEVNYAEKDATLDQ